jgi:hypothetical protein
VPFVLPLTACGMREREMHGEAMDIDAPRPHGDVDDDGKEKRTGKLIVTRADRGFLCNELAME